MTRPLRIGLNLVYWERDSGGSARYARELIRGLLDLEPRLEITAFVSRSLPEDAMVEPWAPAVRWWRFDVPASGTPAHFWPQLAGIAVAAARLRLDLVHGLAYLAPPVMPGTAMLVTVLDTIWMQYPESVNRRFRLLMGALAPLCARAADRVLAISNDAARDLTARLAVPAAKIDVTPLGIRPVGPPAAADADQVRSRFGLSRRPVILCVAQKRVHKNLATLLRAVAEMTEEAPQVVLPGSPTAHEDELRSLASQLGVADRVLFPAWVSEEELDGLYAMAACFCLPSFSEGFGLPVLEAMVRGVPVVCADAAALPEVAGDAALLFDPHDHRALAAALRRVIAEPALAADLAQRGRARAREYTWERTARATLAAYRRATEGRAGA
jgi:glycosyltransferase involved in cell wall biosynthesis